MSRNFNKILEQAKINQYLDLLGIEGGNERDIVKALKAKTLQNHPDRGGKEEVMKNLTQAKTDLIAHLEATGTTEVRRKVVTQSRPNTAPPRTTRQQAPNPSQYQSYSPPPRPRSSSSSSSQSQQQDYWYRSAPQGQRSSQGPRTGFSAGRSYPRTYPQPQQGSYSYPYTSQPSSAEIRERADREVSALYGNSVKQAAYIYGIMDPSLRVRQCYRILAAPFYREIKPARAMLRFQEAFSDLMASGNREFVAANIHNIMFSVSGAVRQEGMSQKQVDDMMARMLEIVKADVYRLEDGIYKKPLADPRAFLDRAYAAASRAGMSQDAVREALNPMKDIERKISVLVADGESARVGATYAMRYIASLPVVDSDKQVMFAHAFRAVRDFNNIFGTDQTKITGQDRRIHAAEQYNMGEAYNKVVFEKQQEAARNQQQQRSRTRPQGGRSQQQYSQSYSSSSSSPKYNPREPRGEGMSSKKRSKSEKGGEDEGIWV